MMADKDCETVMAELAPHFEHVITVPVQNPRMVAPEELAKIAKKYCVNVTAKENASKGAIPLYFRKNFFFLVH